MLLSKRMKVSSPELIGYLLIAQPDTMTSTLHPVIKVGRPLAFVSDECRRYGLGMELKNDQQERKYGCEKKLHGI
jgi:hypothetical protein